MGLFLTEKGLGSTNRNYSHRLNFCYLLSCNNVSWDTKIYKKINMTSIISTIYYQHSMIIYNHSYSSCGAGWGCCPFRSFSLVPIVIIVFKRISTRLITPSNIVQVYRYKWVGWYVILILPTPTHHAPCMISHNDSNNNNNNNNNNIVIVTSYYHSIIYVFLKLLLLLPPLLVLVLVLVLVVYVVSYFLINNHNS